MRTETFINYKGYLWMWLMLAASLGMVFWYYIDQPVAGRSGSSTFGYVSGILAALAILYLMWFGIRKRSYYAHLVSLKSWLAAHIWIGLSLLLIVPLHAAFDFGLNVHTLAYVFLVLVVLSGIVGTFFYRFLPAETISNRGAGAIKKRLEDYDSINLELEKYLNSKSSQFRALVSALDFNFRPELWSAVFSRDLAAFDQKLAVEKLSEVPDSERSDAIKVIALLSRKRDTAAGLKDEIVVRAKLKAWLYFHIPLSLGLLVALAIHIFSIFYFI